MLLRRKSALLLSLGMGPALALAQAAPPQAADLELRIERCSVLGDASARLACYDGLARTTPTKQAAGGAAVGVPDPGNDSKLVNNVVMPKSTQPAEPPPAADAAIPAKVAELTTIPPQDKVSRMVQWLSLIHI